MDNLYALYGGYMRQIVMVGTLEQCINIYDECYFDERVVCPYEPGETVSNLFQKYKWVSGSFESKIVYRRGDKFWKIEGNSESLTHIVNFYKDKPSFWSKIDKINTHPDLLKEKEIIFSCVFCGSSETADFFRNQEGVTRVKEYFC